MVGSGKGWLWGARGTAWASTHHTLPAVSFTRTIASPSLPPRCPSPRSQSGLLSPAEERLPSSRYETDFTELRALGRGGYGVVVAGGRGCACLWS